MKSLTSFNVGEKLKICQTSFEDSFKDFYKERGLKSGAEIELVLKTKNDVIIQTEESCMAIHGYVAKSIFCEPRLKEKELEK